MKSRQKLKHVIQLCERKKGMLYITVVKIRGVKSRTPNRYSTKCEGNSNADVVKRILGEKNNQSEHWKYYNAT